MVPRDVVVKVLPNALDPIVIWAIRRQEMQFDFVGQGIDGDLRSFAAVNSVVV